MIIIEELAAELQIEFAAELVDALSDTLALKFYILVIGKTDLKHRNHPLKKQLYIKEG